MPDRRTWHFDRSVNLPTALTIVSMLCAAGLYVMQQNTRQTATEGRVSAVEGNVKEMKSDLRSDVLRVESKLDQLIMSDRKK